MSKTGQFAIPSKKRSEAWLYTSSGYYTYSARNFGWWDWWLSIRWSRASSSDGARSCGQTFLVPRLLFPYILFNMHAHIHRSRSYKQMPMKYKAVSACKDIYIHIWTVFIYIVIWNYIWQKHIPFPSIYLKVASRHSLRSDPDAFEALSASHLKPARDEVERTLVIAKSKDVIALMFFSI